MYLISEPLVGKHLPRVYDDGESEHDVPHDLEGPDRPDDLRHRVAEELLLLHRVVAAVPRRIRLGRRPALLEHFWYLLGTADLGHLFVNLYMVTHLNYILAISSSLQRRLRAF